MFPYRLASHTRVDERLEPARPPRTRLDPSVPPIPKQPMPAAGWDCPLCGWWGAVGKLDATANLMCCPACVGWHPLDHSPWPAEGLAAIAHEAHEEARQRAWEASVASQAVRPRISRPTAPCTVLGGQKTTATLKRDTRAMRRQIASQCKEKMTHPEVRP